MNQFRRLFHLYLIASLTISAGCTAISLPPPRNNDLAQQNKMIIAALQAQHYADAIDAVRHSQASIAEIDFAIGEIILQGWADADPAQRPHETLANGIALLEKSALAGHLQAISGLAALFFTGLAQGNSEKMLIARHPQLHACWRAAEVKPDQAASCVALRNAGANFHAKQRVFQSAAPKKTVVS